VDEETRSVIEALEQRVRALEDQIALYQAVSAYGPAVDSLSAEAAASLWTEDGVYDAGGPPAPQMNGREAIIKMVNTDPHQSLAAQGCGHMMTLPLLKVDGDQAVGLGYHRLYQRAGDGFKLWRLTASRWDWVRQPDGWKAARRTHRVIDGGDEARSLLRDTLREIRGD
jgi:hypothetical protein